MIVAAMTSADVIIEKKRGAIEVSSSRRRKYYHWEQRYRCHFRCLFPRKKDMVIQTGSQLRYDQGRNCVKMALRDVVQELLPGREILIGFLRPQSLGDFCFGVFCRRCYCVCWSLWWTYVQREPWRPGIWLLVIWRMSESCDVLTERANTLMAHANALRAHAMQNYDALTVRARKFLSGYFAHHDLVLPVIADLARN